MRRDMLNRGVCILLILGLFASCKAKKVATAKADSVTVAVTQPAESANTVRANKLASVKSSQASFNTLSGKAKAALSIGSNSNDVTMNIRIKNNEAIWVSVTAIAGLEVARALITPDSVRVINRLENEYIKKPFSYLYEFTNNKINFATLQSILVGNVISEFVTESTEVNMTGAQAELRSSIGSMMYKVVLNDQNKVVTADLSDAAAAQSLLVHYGDFQMVSQQQIPHSIVMKSQAKSKKISLDLKFSKIELDGPVDIPFRVPDRYTIKN
ncbi:DUF4292 domain-containing protein [Daejeonella sp.]|uniref:DUF4292 domain-containing protein n=1 Tax=Daejeonella sp. TaxID=2805397 RepID=UPI0030C09CD4